MYICKGNFNAGLHTAPFSSNYNIDIQLHRLYIAFHVCFHPTTLFRHATQTDKASLLHMHKAELPLLHGTTSTPKVSPTLHPPNSISCFLRCNSSMCEHYRCNTFFANNVGMWKLISAQLAETDTAHCMTWCTQLPSRGTLYPHRLSRFT